MYCRNCGNLLGEGQSFCPACGTQKVEESNVNNNIQQAQPVQQPVEQTQPVQQPVVNNPTPVVNNPTPVVNNQVPNNMNNNQVPKKKKSGVPVIVFVILGIFVGLIILGVIGGFAIMGIISDSSNKLICTSDEGNITLMYNDEQLLGYTASGMTYDLDDQKEYAKKVGIETYLDEFNDWFEKNTTGTCTRKGVQGAESTHDNVKSNADETTTKTEEGQVIGDKKYGYITVPNNWVKFYDVDGTTALQYSYAGVYIVTMDYIREETTYTAKEYAQSYMAQKKKDTSVSGVTGATVKIGKNSEYTAYQIYMYYPSDGTYLVTYWFESEDGVIRYLALEGPAELSGTKITDYLHIPESFSLNK